MIPKDIKPAFWWTALAVVVIVVVAPKVYNTISSSTPARDAGEISGINPTVDVKIDATIPATKVLVGTFYDGEDGFSLSIPSGNTSTCIWNNTGGNASVPHSETTYARTATEKHTIHTNPSLYDWSVLCVDDFGNKYVGVFPEG